MPFEMSVRRTFSDITRDFEKLPYESYVKKRPKHEPTDGSFYLSRHLAKCMMIDGALNSHVYPARMEMNGT